MKRESCSSHPKSDLETIFSAFDYITGHQFAIARCCACGSTVTSPQPSRMEAYYPAGYYGGPQKLRFPALVEKLQHWLYHRRVQWIESAAGTTRGNVLDVGCGRGLLLKEFQQRGWTTVGTELSDAAATHAREVLGLQIAVGELSAVGFPSGKFDVVTLWHVLEHLPEPRALLTEVNRILKPGGTCFIGVPNFGGWEARLCGNKWFHLDAPRHLTHFTEASLAGALQEAGFRPRIWNGFALEYDIFSFVQSVLNLIGLRHNLLYNQLRKGSAKLFAGNAVAWWQLLTTTLLALPLGMASGPITLAAGLAKRGGCLSVLATKVANSSVDRAGRAS